MVKPRHKKMVGIAMVVLLVEVNEVFFKSSCGPAPAHKGLGLSGRNWPRRRCFRAISLRGKGLRAIDLGR